MTSSAPQARNTMRVPNALASRPASPAPAGMETVARIR